MNGELLAAPWVALGVLALVVALAAESPRRRVLAGAAAGSAAVVSVLVKQNMADVVVVGALLAGIAVTSRARRAPVAALAGSVVGATATACAAVVWTAAHGTSVSGVLWAMYPFRVEAAAVLARSTGAAAHGRLLSLGGAALISGLMTPLLLAVVALWSGGSRTPGILPWRGQLLVGLGWSTWAATSILAGGNYWSHYLVQLALPVALLVGVLSVRLPRLTGAAVSWLVTAAAVSVGVIAVLPPRSTDETVGASLAAASVPGDSVVVTWGHAAVVRTSGLSSPYDSLWSLPTKTRDPLLTHLDSVLGGPDAPTWVVLAPRLATWGLSTDRTAQILHDRYRGVADVCGDTVLLRDHLHRPAPSAASCG